MRTQTEIVAGAGIWGCTIARRLAEKGRSVLVLEKRPVIGGNVRCEIDSATGIEIHSYGSHIFHTQIPEVWRFVNRFVSFNGYQHKVVARHNGRDYFLPLGLTLINKFFGVELKPCEVTSFMADESHSKAIFDAFFRNYTSKQWNKLPEEIDPSIIKRVPVRNSYDVNYFNDYWQGIPTEGYNVFFERMLDHQNITIKTGSSFKLEKGRFVIFDEVNKTSTDLPVSTSDCNLYYSGPIDALFDYKFGALPWRTLRFEIERVPVADAQGTSVVNYVDSDILYTRQHEFKHYHPEPIGPLSQAESIKSGEETILMREYSATWKLGDEPYYPVNNEESTALLKKYQDEAAKIPNLVIGGRLGQYKYFDMDKSIQAALEVAI